MSAPQKYPERYFRFETDINAKPIVGHRHYHNAFEIYYLEKGECHYFIHNKSYEVKEGDLILIPEGVIHHTTYKEGIHSRKLLYCSQAFIPSSVAGRLPSLLYLYRNEAVADEIKKIFSDIEREYSSPDVFSQGIVAAKVELLFFILVRNENQAPKTSEGNAYVSAAVEYIRKNFSGEISLSDVARHVSVSPEHLSRIFKKETGFGFSEYLTLVRLQKAEELLRNEKTLSVAEIAYRCGFNDSNYFCEKFKKSYGVSPLKYKKSSLS